MANEKKASKSNEAENADVRAPADTGPLPGDKPTNPPTGQTKDTPRPRVVKPVSKLTAKVLFPNVKKIGRSLTEDEPGPVFLGRILGLARGYEVVPSEQYGDSLRFKGEFRGFDSAGDAYISANAFVPMVLSEQLQMALDGRDEAHKTQAIEFAADLFLQFSESSATGYTYVVEVHTEARASEPLSGLIASLPALPTPGQA